MKFFVSSFPQFVIRHKPGATLEASNLHQIFRGIEKCMLQVQRILVKHFPCFIFSVFSLKKTEVQFSLRQVILELWNHLLIVGCVRHAHTWIEQLEAWVFLIVFGIHKGAATSWLIILSFLFFVHERTFGSISLFEVAWVSSWHLDWPVGWAGSLRILRFSE